MYYFFRMMFAPGQLAVALGRAKSPDQISLSNFNRYCYKKHPDKVNHFYNNVICNTFQEDLTCCRLMGQDNEHDTEDSDNDDDDDDDDGGNDDDDEEDDNSMDDDDKTDSAQDFVQLDDDDDDDNDDDADGDNDGGCNDLQKRNNEDDIPNDLKPEQVKKHITPKHTINATQKEMQSEIEQIQNKRLKKFIRIHYNCISTLTLRIDPGKGKKTLNSQKVFYAKFYQYISTTEFLETVRSLFNTNALRQHHRVIASKILTIIRENVIVSISRMKTNCIDHVDHQAVSIEEMPDAVRGTIRYVGGYVVKTLRARAIQGITSGLSKNGNIKKAELLSQLKVSEAEVKETTSDKASLEEITRREKKDGCLTQINDLCYMFFVRLISSLHHLYNIDTLCIHKSLIFNHVIHVLRCDTILKEEFLSLFTTEIKRVNSTLMTEAVLEIVLDIAFQAATLSQLFDDIIILTSRTYQAEFRRKINDQKCSRTFARRTAVLLSQQNGQKRYIYI